MRRGGHFFRTPPLNGRYALRLAIGNFATTWEDLEEVWELIKQLASDSRGQTEPRPVKRSVLRHSRQRLHRGIQILINRVQTGAMDEPVFEI